MMPRAAMNGPHMTDHASGVQPTRTARITASTWSITLSQLKYSWAILELRDGDTG